MVHPGSGKGLNNAPCRRPSMTFSATDVRFDDDLMWVDLFDGRTLGVPLAWVPRLLRATSTQRKRVEISRTGLHWEELDEDISIAGLLAGRGDQAAARKDVGSRQAASPNLLPRPGEGVRGADG